MKQSFLFENFTRIIIVKVLFQSRAAHVAVQNNTKKSLTVIDHITILKHIITNKL